jgi:hypothetical protein
VPILYVANKNPKKIYLGIDTLLVDMYNRNNTREKKMTVQVQNTVRRLVARHGYSATFVQHLGEGIVLYSIGGIMYRIRGDGTIL